MIYAIVALALSLVLLVAVIVLGYQTATEMPDEFEN